MTELLKLIRIRNLAFAAFTMYAMRYFVIRPLLEAYGFSLQMSEWRFTLNVIAVCCLISGAYVINDYFDAKSDRISGIRNVVVGRSISRRTAITLHSLLNVVAVFIAMYLGIVSGKWEIGLLYLLVSGILWLYSSAYKKHFITGNILVAFLTAFIPMSALIYEIPLLNRHYADILTENNFDFLYIFNWILGYSWLIFINTLIYEMNKDIYTEAGDRENGNRTIPVLKGAKIAREIITALVWASLISLGILCGLKFISFPVIVIYILGTIVIPYVFYLFSIRSNKEHRKFQLILIRLITVLCVSTCFFMRCYFQMIYTD